MDTSLPHLSPCHAGEPTVVVALTHDERRKSRLRARLSDGREVGILQPRGAILRDGDRLTDGSLVARVAAAPESVSVAETSDPLLLLRAAYHLGNRHVPLQIALGILVYAHDHVLDDMVRSLGLHVRSEQRPFEPEAGAHGGGHSHDHGHDHSHA